MAIGTPSLLPLYVSFENLEKFGIWPGRVIIQNRPFRQGQMGTVFPYGHMGTPTEYYCSYMTILEQKSKCQWLPKYHMRTDTIFSEA